MDHGRWETKNKSNGKSQKANGKGKISGTSSFKLAGSKNQGGACVPPYFGGMSAPFGQGRRHAKLRHVCATRVFHELSRAEGPWGQT
jgi:hypothetical protein